MVTLTGERQISGLHVSKLDFICLFLDGAEIELALRIPDVLAKSVLFNALNISSLISLKNEINL